MQIHIVIGSTGEYSDHQEWPVKAYYSQERAQEHVTNATRKAGELVVMHKNRWDIPKGANEYDPDMQVDYTGVNYYIWELELGDAPIGKLCDGESASHSQQRMVSGSQTNNATKGK